MPLEHIFVSTLTWPGGRGTLYPTNNLRNAALGAARIDLVLLLAGKLQFLLFLALFRFLAI